MESIFSLKKVYFPPLTKSELRVSYTSSMLLYKNKVREYFSYQRLNGTASVISTDFLLIINLYQSTKANFKVESKIPINRFTDGIDSKSDSKVLKIKEQNGIFKFKITEIGINNYLIAILTNSSILLIFKLEIDWKSQTPEKITSLKEIDCGNSLDPEDIEIPTNIDTTKFQRNPAVILSKGKNISIYFEKGDSIEYQFTEVIVKLFAAEVGDYLSIAVVTVKNSVFVAKVENKKVRLISIQNDSLFQPQLITFKSFNNKPVIYVLSSDRVEAFYGSDGKIANYIPLKGLQQQQLLTFEAVDDHLYIFTTSKTYYKVAIFEGTIEKRELSSYKSLFAAKNLSNSRGFLLFGSNSIIPSNFSFLSVLVIDDNPKQRVSEWENIFFALKKYSSLQDSVKVAELLGTTYENQRLAATDNNCTLCGAKVYENKNDGRYSCGNNHPIVQNIGDDLFICIECEFPTNEPSPRCVKCSGAVIKL